MTPRKSRKHRLSPAPLLFLLAAVVAVWALYGVVVFLFPFRGEFWDARGKFGDMFGAFNALFTAGAFAALMKSEAKTLTAPLIEPAPLNHATR